MRRIDTEIPGLFLIEPDVFGDARGYFLETWNERRYREIGLCERFVQDNISFSARGTLRGLHFQHPQAQGKLVSVLQGEVFDVAVDLRRGSRTFGRWLGFALSSDNRRQLYVPPGCAHGFAVVSDQALFHYKCTDFYNRETEGSVRWNDPDLGIEWPTKDPILSARDAEAPPLAQIKPDRLPLFSGLDRDTSDAPHE